MGIAQADWDDHDEARDQAAEADREAYVPDDDPLEVLAWDRLARSTSLYLDPGEVWTPDDAA